MSALSPRRRFALRAVVTSAALAGAVLAPAAAAFADTPAVPGAPAAPAAKAAEPGTATAPAPKASAESGRKQDRPAQSGEQQAEKEQQPQSQSDKKAEPSSFTLVDGHRMGVGKDRPDNFRAELVVDGHVVLILSSKGNSVGYWGGMRVVLNADGTVESSWAGGGKGASAAAAVRGHSAGTSVQAVSAAAAQTKAIPAGGVAAGAEGVGEQSGDHQVLLASGGALASVGAAGIGFAVLYRRRKAVGANV
ncbi:hypothetical protein ACFY2W_16520 [Streptomyces sp. NPDC001262]|uniref:hypothetical protein n=1 Tax=Streptomyces sp. NPDC001262 TaxID=3364552 RepID=UPI0036BBC289